MPGSLPRIPEVSPRAIRENIEAVAELEDSFQRNRSLADRIADAIGAFAGSTWFLLLHIIMYGGWIVINLGWVPGVRKFDPYPFLLLSVCVSLEAIFLSTFVLMKQNRMARREDMRAHLDLQINLLAEREMTLVLKMLEAISKRVGVRLPSEEIAELSEVTSVEALASELKDKLQTD